MSKIISTIACIGFTFIGFAHAQVSTSSTVAPPVSADTTVSMDVTGRIIDYTPDSALVLDTGGGEPVHYKFAKKVTYVDTDGREVQALGLRKNLRVRVHYLKVGGDMLVDKVTLTE
jgi:hypothetical protein